MLPVGCCHLTNRKLWTLILLSIYTIIVISFPLPSPTYKISNICFKICKNCRFCAFCYCEFKKNNYLCSGCVRD